MARSAFRGDDPPEPPAWPPVYGGSVGRLALWWLWAGSVVLACARAFWVGVYGLVLAVSQLVRSGGLVGQVGMVRLGAGLERTAPLSLPETRTNPPGHASSPLDLL